ncbi:MAG: hypothetical protein RLZZ221_1720 [Verrucomicrobiota bacterium]
MAPVAPDGDLVGGATRAHYRADRSGGGCEPALGVLLPRRFPHRRWPGAAEAQAQARQAADFSRCRSRSDGGAAARREVSPRERRAGVDRGAYQAQVIVARRLFADAKSRRGLRVPRKTYGKKDAEQAEALRVTQAKKLSEASAGAEGPVRLWMRDEHRYGLLPAIRRCRGLRGVRVRAPYATRYQWGYLHEALEVDCVNRLELLLTQVIDQDFNAAFLRQISETRPTGRHNVIQGQAGIHIQSADSRRPANVRLVPLPPYSPELNPVERLGDVLKDATCKRLFTALRPLEDAIPAESKPLHASSARVGQSIKNDRFSNQVESGG